MRGALLVGPAVIILAAAAVDALPARATSCAEAVRWHGETYLGIGPSKRPLTLGVALSGGVEPGCQDRDGPPVADTPVRLRAIVGISVRAALVRADRPNRIFLAPGFLPQLPDFPLHDAIYGSRSKPDERTWKQPPGKRRFKCDSVVRRTIVGSVRSALFGIRLRVGRKEQALAVDVRTRVAREPGTLPRLQPGV